MFTLSTGEIQRMLLNLEIFRERPHLSANARQRRRQKRHGHGAIALFFIRT
jgi:hypothetical protein